MNAQFSYASSHSPNLATQSTNARPQRRTVIAQCARSFSQFPSLNASRFNLNAQLSHCPSLFTCSKPSFGHRDASDPDYRARYAR